MITEVNIKTTKNNQMMAFVNLEDLFGNIECIIFPKTFKHYNNLINEENLVIMEGTLNVKEEEQPKVLVNTINPLLKISGNELKTWIPERAKGYISKSRTRRIGV